MPSPFPSTFPGSPSPQPVITNGLENCGCSDNSFITANTGLATVAIANSNLDGSGFVTTVLTAGNNGTTIKSIIIKARQPNTTGMVRLFIEDTVNNIKVLWREIPMPVNPVISATPTPTPVLPMLEIDLVNELKLNAGFKLLASTQVSESFNVIAEGVDWFYPENVLSTCCDLTRFVANTGVGVVSVANPNLDGTTGTYAQIFTVGALANGSIIKSITIAAMQSTSINGMVRLFLDPNGTGLKRFLMMEIMVPQTNQAGFIPSFKLFMKENYYLQAGYVIWATTQTTESFSIIIEGDDWSYPTI